MTAPPLEGLRVLDLSQSAPGWFASMLLADFGADVVIVEDTGGDGRRGSGPRYPGSPESTGSALWVALQRGKRSARIDPAHPDGVAALLRVAERADVVLEDRTPGDLVRLGLGYERLAAVNSRIVLASISGYGQDGPAAQRPGEDLSRLALTGALELTGELDGPPIPPAVPIADLAGGALMCVIGILLALTERERSGRGQHVDASMYDGTLALMLGHAAAFFATGVVPERGTASQTGGRACYLPYLVKDGWVTLAASDPARWARLCHALGREELLEHHDAPIDSWAHGQLELIFLRRTRAEWKAFADEHPCGVEPVLTVEEALDSSLARARKMVVAIAQPGVSGARALGVPVKLSRTPGADRTEAAPGAGADTDAVLAEAGFGPEEIAALRAGAAIH